LLAILQVEQGPAAETTPQFVNNTRLGGGEHFGRIIVLQLGLSPAFGRSKTFKRQVENMVAYYRDTGSLRHGKKGWREGPADLPAKKKREAGETQRSSYYGGEIKILLNRSTQNQGGFNLGEMTSLAFLRDG